MKRFIAYILVFLASAITATAQKTLPKSQAGARNNSSSKNSKQAFIRPNVKAWKMVDQYTLADTIPVDTLTNGHQINNKIWKNNVMNVTLGNFGSPYIPMLYMNRRRTDGYIFLNTLQEYTEQPQDFVYYNTKTPYTNLAYNMGFPKRRSEEFVQVLFTQNVNRRLNVGIHYKFSTSIGRYSNQRADHASVRLFSSYDGDNYKSQFSGIYTRSDINENGGITNDEFVLQTYPTGTDQKEYDKAEDIPVFFMDQTNRHATYQLHYAHQLDLGHVDRIDPVDSTEYEVPVATAYHQIHLMRNHHEYRTGDLSSFGKTLDELFPMTQDTTKTDDRVKYGMVTNTFNLKLNEEFNSLLRFGLRGFIGNDVKSYHWPDTIHKYTNEDGDWVREYQRQGVTKVSMFFGGQIFKNKGEHVRLNAGIKQYITGYNAGDMILNGSIDNYIRVLNQPVKLWGKVIYELKSPEVYHEHYCSNHYRWNKNLDRQNTLSYSGGIKMDSLRLELTVFGSSEKNKIYFNSDGKPDQSGKLVNIIGAYLYKHFSVIGFNSINRLAVQSSFDNDDIEPLPLFSIYSSNFYERLLFNVLTFQIGFDWRYNTRYYAPKYIPAIMQFCPQDKSDADSRKVGGHHYIDPFVNMQLKRARIYVKYEHVNTTWGDKDYFHTVHYPANPGFFKFGVSWNFYD